MGRFVNELKRRSVVRIGVAYLVVTWLLLQITDVLISLGVLPETVGRYAFYVLLLCFPLALVFAWAYEFTPEGIKLDRDVDRTTSSTSASSRKFFVLIIGAFLAGILVAILGRYIPGTVSDPFSQDNADRPKSIAVLPFVNLSDDPSQEYFVDGMTEELLNILVAIKDLRVTSRTSSFAFRGQNVPVTEIAARLGVDHVLEGSIRKSGDTIRVTAQLIDSRTDTHLWSDTYDRELKVSNLLDIQQEVAEAVAEALHAKILPQARNVLRAEGPANLTAFDLYLDGMFFRRQIETGTGKERVFENAIEKFEASIEADPNWAPAHAALGLIYHFWKDEGDRVENLRISKQHLMKAIDLDDQYGPAYASLAYVSLRQGDFDAAARAINRAWALGFDSPWGNALYFMALSRFDEAVDEYRKAVAVDPLSLPVKYQLAWSYSCADRYPEAIKAYDVLRESFPEDSVLNQALAYAHVKMGNVAQGLELAEKVANMEGEDGPVAVILALAGLRDRALAALNAAEASGDVSRIAMATLAIALGDEDRALTLLEHESTEAPHEFLFIRCSAEIRSLAGNPRYERVLDRIGFPD